MSEKSGVQLPCPWCVDTAWISSSQLAAKVKYGLSVAPVCRYCSGHGTIHQDRMQWFKHGMRAMEFRVGVLNMSIEQLAYKLGRTVQEILIFEAGSAYNLDYWPVSPSTTFYYPDDK